MFPEEYEHFYPVNTIELAQRLMKPRHELLVLHIQTDEFKQESFEVDDWLIGKQWQVLILASRFINRAFCLVPHTFAEFGNKGLKGRIQNLLIHIQTCLKDDLRRNQMIDEFVELCTSFVDPKREIIQTVYCCFYPSLVCSESTIPTTFEIWAFQSGKTICFLSV